MALTHTVLVNADGCGPLWGETGYYWVLGKMEQAEQEAPFEWLRENAHEEWTWCAVGDVGRPTEALIDRDNLLTFDTFHFKFYFASAGDAMLFKLTWT